MTPFIDTVKTMENNSLMGKESLDERGQEDLSLGIQESNSKRKLDDKNALSAIKSIKLTPLKASVHKIQNTTQRDFTSDNI